MKRFLALLTIATAACSATCFQAQAVTPGELEKARTIAAIVYLRNANPTSDYLDNVKASSRSELTSKLKDKEKENLRKFNAALPSSAGSEEWGKKELVEYAKKAVVAPKGYSSTGYASKMVETKVNQLTIAPPKPQEPETETTAEQQQTETPGPSAPDTVGVSANIPDPFTTQASDEIAAQDSALKAAQDTLEKAQAELERNQQEGSSSMFYIVILCVLVVLVIALVIYAARYFNRQNAAKEEEEERERREIRRETRRETRVESRERREESNDRAENVRSRETEVVSPYAPKSSREEDERDEAIASLKTENAELRKVIEEYRYQLDYMKAEQEKAAASAPRHTLGDRFQNNESTTLNDRYASEPRQPIVADTEYGRQRPETDSRTTGKRPTVIYLGRANAEGMFVRAERNLNPQHSLFRLVTTDNLTGVFTVAENEDVEERILGNPEFLLAMSCEVENPDTYGKEAVATEDPGTAIFKKGRWHVLRPARVKFV